MLRPLVRMNLLSTKLWRRKKKFVSFAAPPQSAQVTATLCDKCLVKMEKALDLWVEDMNRKCVLTGGKVLGQKASSLYQDFSKGCREISDTKPFTTSKVWLQRFRNRFGLKNIKITGVAASASEEAVPHFWQLKRLIKEKGCHTKQVFNYNEAPLKEDTQQNLHS